MLSVEATSSIRHHNKQWSRYQMAATFQQFNSTYDTLQRVNEVSISSLKSQIYELTHLARNMATESTQQARVCGIYEYSRHPTDICPTLQKDDLQQVNSIGGFQINCKEDMTIFPTHTTSDGETTQMLAMEQGSKTTNNIQIGCHSHHKQHLQNKVCLLKKS